MTTALQMRWRLRRLQRAYGIAPAPVEVPLSAPQPHAQLIEAVASTDAMDLDRMKLRAFCFGMLRPDRVRLLWKHDPTQIAGQIEELRYDAHGHLVLKAVVEHELARRANALSVGFRLIEGSIQNPDSDRFFGLVERAELTEISLVTTPSNLECTVTSKMRVPPERQFYELMQRRVQLLMTLTTQLQEMRA